ncbi:hypothetical protein H6P81_014062 [Aristolochia fimbriata]|uniref:Uncharacterized protein n=1 Tax=Aristolochia fimbriata TaxID=158543 RepID=A0AAV7EGX6_ARIFI|nr:hypothetical protein H6P81_014062 [Aristolochia fimbriata]
MEGRNWCGGGRRKQRNKFGVGRRKRFGMLRMTWTGEEEEAVWSLRDLGDSEIVMPRAPVEREREYDAELSVLRSSLSSSTLTGGGPVVVSASLQTKWTKLQIPETVLVTRVWPLSNSIIPRHVVLCLRCSGTHREREGQTTAGARRQLRRKKGDKMEDRDLVGVGDGAEVPLQGPTPCAFPPLNYSSASYVMYSSPGGGAPPPTSLPLPSGPPPLSLVS